MTHKLLKPCVLILATTATTPACALINGTREEIQMAANETVCHRNSALATEIAIQRLIKKHPAIKREDIQALISGRCAKVYIQELPVDELVSGEAKND